MGVVGIQCKCCEVPGALRMGVSICCRQWWLQTSGCCLLGSVVVVGGCRSWVRGNLLSLSLSLCWPLSLFPCLPFLPFLFLSVSLSLLLCLSSLSLQNALLLMCLLNNCFVPTIWWQQVTGGLWAMLRWEEQGRYPSVSETTHCLCQALLPKLQV